MNQQVSQFDRANLLAAVNDLIADPNPVYKLEAFETVATLNRNYPVRLTGELAVLNPLLEIRISDAAKWANLQGFIDAKREVNGMEPLWPPEAPRKFDKTSYQRELMALRRARSGRAVEIENLQRPEGEKIRGVDRLEFERRQLAAWGQECKGQIEAARKHRGGHLTKDQTDLIRMRYWENLDKALDEREAAVRAELLKPAHKRRHV
jgi:hypothetical protein